MQQRKKSQLGAIMVEVIAALALIGIMGSVLYRQIQRRNEEIDNINIASEVRIVKEATTAYIQANRPYLELVVCPSSEPYVKAASNNAIDAYMPINWACDEGMENCLIDEFDIWFACDTMGSSGSERKMIWGLIVPRPESLPLKYDLRRAARIANLIGADGGVSDGIESGGNLTLYGTQGAWENLCGTDTYSPCYGRGVMHVAVTGMDVYVPEVETASIAANKVTVPNSLALDFLHSSSYFSVGNNDRNCIDNLVAGEYAHETIEDNKAVSDIILPPGATKGIGASGPCAPLFWVGTPKSSSGDTSDSSQVYVKNSLFVGRDNDTDSQALALRGGSDDEERGITVYDADGKSRIMLDAAEGRILGRIYDGKGYKLNAETGEITLFQEYYAVINRHFTDVDQCVAHATQRCIDGYACDIGYLLETEILIVAHKDYLTLIIGQSINQTAHITQCLLINHHILDVGFGQTGIIQEIILLCVIADGVLILVLTEIVNDEIMCYTG